ncbi:tryptophan--tRNA ligase [bacterium]|nr:tryptophan--tRNA ligase [bacterium]
MKKTILSGMRPTGKLHLGNLEGALRQWIALQDEYNCFWMIADWHALTTGYENAREIKDNVIQVAVDFLSAGLDPEKSAIFRQSAVKEHAELHLLFSMITPTPWLIRNPTIKEQAREMGLIGGEGEEEMVKINYGLLGYPVLQAADILIYKADFVPVGKDQLSHLEITREIARRFNYLYKPIFPEPQPIIGEYPLILGIDGRKMSKSYDNCIFISDSPDVIRRKIANMFTDPQRIYRSDPGHPEECPVFLYQQIYNQSASAQIKEDCKNAKIGCVDCKRICAEALIERLAPIRAKREELERTPSLLTEILQEGARKAREVASRTMEEVREAIGAW